MKDINTSYSYATIVLVGKVVVLLFVVAIFLVSCVKKNTPVIPLDDTVDTMAAMQINSGMFINGPYGSVSGRAAIYTQDGNLQLALENLSSSNGPELHVYISKEVQPVNFIDLGSLKSTFGNQLYSIPGNPDLKQYKYALIHCVKYNHLFGSAKLE